MTGERGEGTWRAGQEIGEAERVRSSLAAISWLALTVIVACSGDDDAGASPGGGGSGGAAAGASGAGHRAAGHAGGGRGGEGGSAGTGGGAGRGGAGGSGGGSGGSGDLCAGRRGTCVPVCQGGQCDCQCDCRTDAECGSDGVRCLAPDEPTPPCCGAPGPCALGQPCPSADQICSGGVCGFCVARCTPESCGSDDFVCGPAGLCVPARCDTDGYTCPPNSRCVSGATAPDPHGCVPDACERDADCPGGVCVNGGCHAGAGRCIFTTCA